MFFLFFVIVFCCFCCCSFVFSVMYIDSKMVENGVLVGVGMEVWGGGGDLGLEQEI